MRTPIHINPDAERPLLGAPMIPATFRSGSSAAAAAASKRFGSSALKVHDKIVAMISHDGRFVVKLPRARVDALVARGAGERFDASRGRPMREWFEVPSESPDDWLDLAREALQFVGT